MVQVGLQVIVQILVRRNTPSGFGIQTAASAVFGGATAPGPSESSALAEFYNGTVLVKLIQVLDYCKRDILVVE
jgi:hypothetical protein